MLLSKEKTKEDYKKACLELEYELYAIRKITDNYITNLQEENKELGRYYTRANNEFLELNKRINKAIEYCELNKEFTPRLVDIENILKGEDKE